MAVYRTNLDGSQARYYYAHAPQGTPLLRLAQVAASRWNIETEFETNKSDIGLDEYEVSTSVVTERGLLGDRAYALLDRETGPIASAKHPRKRGRLFELRRDWLPLLLRNQVELLGI